jgi:hypothetical protein
MVVASTDCAWSIRSSLFLIIRGAAVILYKQRLSFFITTVIVYLVRERIASMMQHLRVPLKMSAMLDLLRFGGIGNVGYSLLKEVRSLTAGSVTTSHILRMM